MSNEENVLSREVREEKGAVKIKVRWIRFHLISKCVTLTPRFWIERNALLNGCQHSSLFLFFSPSVVHGRPLPCCPSLSFAAHCVRDIRDISSSPILKSMLPDRSSQVTWSVIHSALILPIDHTVEILAKICKQVPRYFEIK